jgi:hypothetical protein
MRLLNSRRKSVERASTWSRRGSGLPRCNVSTSQAWPGAYWAAKRVISGPTAPIAANLEMPCASQGVKLAASKLVDGDGLMFSAFNDWRARYSTWRSISLTDAPDSTLPRSSFSMRSSRLRVSSSTEV